MAAVTDAEPLFVVEDVAVGDVVTVTDGVLVIDAVFEGVNELVSVLDCDGVRAAEIEDESAGVGVALCVGVGGTTHDWRTTEPAAPAPLMGAPPMYATEPATDATFSSM